MDSPVDWSRLREQMVLEEEYAAAARTGRTSRGGAGSAAPPMGRDDGRKLRARWGDGPLPNKKTRLGHLLRVWYARRPRPRPTTNELEWMREVAQLRDKLGMKEAQMAKQKRTRITREDIYQAVVSAAPGGITATWCATTWGVDRQMALEALKELHAEGKVKMRPAPRGPRGGRTPVEFYVEPTVPAAERITVTPPLDPALAAVPAPGLDCLLHNLLAVLAREIRAQVESHVREEVERRVRRAVDALNEAVG